MFIKRVYQFDSKLEQVWECSSYSVSHDCKDIRIIIWNEAKKSEDINSYKDDKNLVGIWVMNNDGKTVDTIFTRK